MDYDLTDIPEAYDRARDHGPEVLELWMNAIGAHLEGRTVEQILDLGCGTGRFTTALAARFDARVLGVDPSLKMLEQARAKQRDVRVSHLQGRAEAIPLEPDSVDAIFMSMCFHHFDDRDAAARECRRVLRAGGSVFLRTGTRERIADYAYVPFLPQTVAILEQVLPDAAGFRAPFDRAGFSCVAQELVTQTIAPSWAAYADKLAAGGDSILARLSREELEAALAQMRDRHARGDEPIVEPIDLFVFR